MEFFEMEFDEMFISVGNGESPACPDVREKASQVIPDPYTGRITCRKYNQSGYPSGLGQTGSYRR